MGEIRRPLTEKEWSAIKTALPAFRFLDEIEYVKECCWNCKFYSGFEGQPGKCLHFEIDIPNDQRAVEHECFEMRVIPF